MKVSGKGALALALLAALAVSGEGASASGRGGGGIMKDLFSAGGRFDEAVAVATRAVKLAKEAGRDRLADELEARVQIFKRSESWTESVPHRTPPTLPTDN